MKIHQLSLFMENKPGKMIEPCRILACAGIDIRTLTLADTQQFGILRLIVSDWQRSMELLKEAGYVVKVTEVVAVEVPDRPGGLVELMEVFSNSGINIEYMYAFTFGRQDTAVLIFRFDKPDDAIQLMQSAGINVVGSVDVYNRIGK
ncbi:MAG: ACT domain-containing protein [Acidobacteria bacterium]|nr:ACT domain-containing protein [Acidobacteriota bacterium]